MQAALINVAGRIETVAGMVSDTQAEVAGIAATLKETKRRQEEEIPLLFKKHDEHLKITQSIQMDYVPRGEFTQRQAEHVRVHDEHVRVHDEHVKVHDRQREEHEAVAQRLGCIETKVIKLGLIAGGVISILQIAVYALAHYLTR
jgi:hypothetical protein